MYFKKYVYNYMCVCVYIYKPNCDVMSRELLNCHMTFCPIAIYTIQLRDQNHSSMFVSEPTIV